MDFKPFKIGKYLLLERLATGGMAEVYRARASGAGGFEKQLAIKRILPNYSSNEEFRRMFEYEARLSSMLTHANIVQIYDFVKARDTYLLAMEYVDGKNLRQFVNKVKKMGYSIPIEFSLYVINEVCKGLEYAHNKKDDLTGKPLNIIHRDMSPQNIMLSYDGAVKIVDFGIAKAKDRVDETRSGVIKGKFGYMSPEQANGLPVDHRTDIFSTAIILYELLTNRRLFAADNDLATLKLIQECVIPKPALINPKISYELEKLMMRGLSKDFSNRYQNAGQFHRQLQEYLNKEYGSFTQREVSDILHRVFASEIDNEKKRYEQLHRQPIPFSQGVTEIDSEEEIEQVEQALEGEVTRSEHEANTAITNAEGEAEEKGPVTFHLDDTGKHLIRALSKDTNSSTIQRSETEALEKTKVESIVPEDETVDALENFESPPRESGTADSISTQMKEPSYRERTQSGMPLFPENSESTVPQKGERSISQTATDIRAASSLSKSDSIDLTNPMNRPLDSRRGSYSLINQVTPAAEEVEITGVRAVKEGRDGRDEVREAVQRERDGIQIETPRKAQYQPTRRHDDSPSSQRKTAIPLLLVMGLIGTTLYLYRLLLTGPFPFQQETEGPRSPGSQVNSIPIPSAGADELSVNRCQLTVSSDPVGATILVNKNVVGVAPRVVFVTCKQSVDITLKKDGYETRSENIVVDKKEQSVLKSLKKIPMGELQFLLDVNAKVYVDGEEVGIAMANKPFSVPVRAEIKHRVRFVNEVLGFEFVQDYTAKDGIKLTFPIKMTEPSRLPSRQ